ncbi:MAG: prephenate dehydratase [Clostridiales bacterium]|jgi:prephenate dehydratase|nr:prephenate dehydratase [Eubacteriales bacterium]MDH7566257.1 prephenate dehydratase [Clostridiales bacterium]
MKKIGFLGPRGTFSQEALEKYTKKSPDYASYDFTSIAEMIMAVENGEMDEAVVPIENSLEGAVNVTLDMMASEVNLLIKSEVIIPVSQNLLVKKGTKAGDIKRILSHPQPIGQCRKYINTRFPGVEIRVVYSTAGAAEEVAKGGGDSAAIGSSAAAEVYNLDILAQDIQDVNNNFTRFVVVSKEDSPRTGWDKTSIVFSTDDKPGALYRVLDIFNLWDINMTRIESRPAKNQLGRYIFFVDISGYKEDEDIRDALTMVRRKTSFYKFLGSYPVYGNI